MLCLLFSCIYLTVLLHGTTTSAADTHTYHVGFPPNFRERTTYLELYITTSSDDEVAFTVQNKKGEVLERGSVSASSIPAKVVYVSPVYIVKSDDADEQEKGVVVQSSAAVSVTVLNSYQIQAGATTGAFRIHSQAHLNLNSYTYISMNYRGASFILITGTSDNTSVAITPTSNIHFASSTMNAGESAALTVNEYTTLLLRSERDLTGTVINSNKPLTVLSGQQCGKVPLEYSGCDQFVAQIPPTAVLGQTHMITPFEGRTSGSLISIVATRKSTTIQHDCTDSSTLPLNKTTLQDIGELLRFNTTNNQYCHLTSNKPILVSQHSFGYGTDEKGDPSMLILTPAEQFVSAVDFTELNHISGEYVTIVTTVNGYHPSHIYLGPTPSTEICNWMEISTLGFSCTVPLTSGMHSVRHIIGKLSAYVYGFEYGHAYAYTAGHAFLPVNSVGFATAHYDVQESSGVVVLPLFSYQAIPGTIEVHVWTISDKATDDYGHLNEVITIDSESNDVPEVCVTIYDDNVAEPPETFTVILAPVSKGVVSERNKATVTIVDDENVTISFLNDTTVGIFNVSLLQEDLTVTANILRILWTYSEPGEDESCTKGADLSFEMFSLTRDSPYYMLSDYCKDLQLKSGMLLLRSNYSNVIFSDPTTVSFNCFGSMQPHQTSPIRTQTATLSSYSDPTEHQSSHVTTTMPSFATIGPSVTTTESSSLSSDDILGSTMDSLVSLIDFDATKHASSTVTSSQNILDTFSISTTHDSLIVISPSSKSSYGMSSSFIHKHSSLVMSSLFDSAIKHSSTFSSTVVSSSSSAYNNQPMKSSSMVVDNTLPDSSPTKSLDGQGMPTSTISLSMSISKSTSLPPLHQTSTTECSTVYVYESSQSIMTAVNPSQQAISNSEELANMRILFIVALVLNFLTIIVSILLCAMFYVCGRKHGSKK